MRTAVVVWCVTVMGCLPRPPVASPPPVAPAPAAPGDDAAPATTAAQDSAAAPRAPTRTAARPANGSETLLGQAPMPPQPYPAPAQQPYPQPAPQPYPQPAPQPYPQPAPQPYPQPAQQPYPAPNAQPYPQPYAPQPYPPQPYPPATPTGQPPTSYPPAYPPAQPYPAAQQYPAPGGTDAASHGYFGGEHEVIADFAALGTLASVDLLVRQDVHDGSIGSFLVAAGVAGGGAIGWLLTEKYQVDTATAHVTTLGLLVGAANGALLIQPTRWNDSDQVLGLLLAGSAIGTVGGFAYGRGADLTSGQSTFVANLALLGSSTAALSAIIGSRDGNFGGWEDGVLAFGLDAGVLGGALIAPGLDWSPRRAKLVLAATALGAFTGGTLAGVLSKRSNGDSSNGDLVAGCMTGGMWGGFALGILMTKDDQPDFRFGKPAPGSPVTVAPYTGDHGLVGMMAGGTW